MKTRTMSVQGLFLLFTFSLLQAQISYNQEFQVSSGGQSDPRLAALSDGGFVLCWTSWEQDGSLDGVFGQLFNSNGEKNGQEFQVNTYSDGDQRHQSISSLFDGGFVICWASGPPDSHTGVFGQRFNDKGEKIGQEFQVNTYTDYDQYYEYHPTITALTEGDFVVIWTSGQYYTDVFGQKFNGTGEKAGQKFQVNTYTDYDQKYPTIAALFDGGFVACWGSGLKDGSTGWGVFGQRFNNNGEKDGNNCEKVGQEFQVNTYAGSNDHVPAIATLSDGGFVVCWDSWQQDGSAMGVFGQRFNSNCKKIGQEFQVNTYTNSYQDEPCISGLSDGGFVICWTSEGQDGSLDGVFGQLFNSNGEKKGQEFQVNTYTDYDQYNPSITTFSDDGFIVCWDGKGQDGSGLFAKYFLTEPISHTLTNFVLVEPHNDATITKCRSTFAWQQASSIRECYPWELTYDLYIDTDYNFASPRIIKDIQDATYFIDSLAIGHTYFWKVLAKNIANDSLWSSNVNGFYVRLDASVGTKEANLPDGFVLEQNYPNPFNPSTEIKYSIPSTGFVTLKIYDIQGRLIRVLCEGNQTAGSHSLHWDGKDESGQNVSSGIYVYKLSFKNSQGQTTVISRKMGLVR